MQYELSKMINRPSFSNFKFSNDDIDRVINDSKEVIFVCDKDEKIQFVNPAFEKLTGYTFEEVVGKTPRILSSGKHAMQFYNSFWKSLEKQKIVHTQICNKKKNGNLYWVNITVVSTIDEDGNIKNYIANCIDITQQEEEKREQSEKILSEIKSIILVMEASGKISYASPSVALLGYSQKEILGEGWWNLTYENRSIMKRSRESFIHNVNSNSGIDLNNYNRKVLCKDGSFKWLNFQISRGTKGTLIGIAHDVTEQVKAENELKESEKRLSLALDVIGFGGWDWDMKTDTVQYTDNWFKKTGYTKQEVQKNKLFWRDTIHPDDLNRVLDKTDKFIKGYTKNKVHFNEYRLLYKSGEYKMNLDRGMVVEWDDNGKPIRMVGIDTDLSQRKLAEDKLYQLSQMIEKNPIPMVITNKEGNVEYANRAYKIYTGRSLKSIMGKTIRLLRFNNEKEKRNNEVWNTVSQGKIWKGEVKVVNKKGKKLCEMVTLSPIINNHGEITNFLSVREDITEKKHLEENFLKAIIAAQEDEKHRLGEELHDGLGQMLGAVNLYLEVLIKNKEKSAAFQLEVLNKVRRLNEAASIEYRSISHGLMSRKLIKDGLLLALKDICDNFKETTSIEFIFLKKGIKDEDFSDHVKLNIYRIVQEITTNIVKHSKAMHAIIKLATNKKKEIILSVTDDGIGIDKNKKKTFNSKGLGLKNIQQRTEIMDGTVKVISNKGEGTIFVIKIPNPLL